MTVYDGPETSADGTSITLKNRNRGAANLTTTDALVFHTPTVTTNGTEFCKTYVPAGEKNAAVGGEDEAANRMIFDAGDYLFAAQNLKDDAGDIFIRLSGHVIETP